MTGERPVCVFAMASLRRNSTRLLVVMCVGIALALYGIYVQARSHSNPHYTPTMTVATNWLYESLGQRLTHPSRLLVGCGGSARNTFKPTVGQLIMHRFIYPVMRYSGLINGFINVTQIMLLKLYAKSFTGTDTIIGLSAFGVVVSMICLVGSFANCRLMCISCLAVHHIAIIYLAFRRRRVLKNMLCPSQSANPSAGATGTSSSTSSSSLSKTASASTSLANAITAAAQPTATRHSNTCTTRRRKEDSSRR